MFPIHIRTARGLEKVLAQELADLGLKNIKIRNRLVTGLGDKKLLYQANLWCRTAIRVLLPIANFAAPEEQDFYNSIKNIDWSPWVLATGTLSIDAHVHSSFTTHSLYLAQLTKDAIVDQFREKTGERPSVDLENPDLRIAVNLFRNQAEISVDASGESLHRRGYRRHAGEAPLNETLAAGIIKLTGWNGSTLFLDPMTGSGTFAIEAGLMAKNIAPGLLRSRFGFQKWQDYDAALFESLVQEARSAIQQESRAKIIAFDQDPKMVSMAKQNIERAGLSEFISLEVRDFFNWDERSETSGTLVMNPPYNERLPVEDMARFCEKLGKEIKDKYVDWSVSCLLPISEATRELKLTPTQKNSLLNGAIECELLTFHPRTELSNESGEALETHEFPLAWKPKIEAFTNRLRKNFKHYSKWAQRERLTCWRVYDRDIPEFPFIIDILGRTIHFAEVPRNHDRSPLEHQQYLQLMRKATAEVTQIPESHVFLKTRKAQKLPKKETSDTIEIKESNRKYYLNLVDYVDYGLNLEYRKVRNWIEKEAKGKDFLNLFAYTGTATVSAAFGGAKSTASVDASSTYLDWAKRNLELNRLKSSEHMFYRSDVLEFLKNSQRVFDLCWVDPPIHSVNRTNGQEFSVQENQIELLRAVLERMRIGGKVLFTTNLQEFQLQEWALKELCPMEVTHLTHSLTPLDFEKSRPFHAWLIEKIKKPLTSLSVLALWISLFCMPSFSSESIELLKDNHLTEWTHSKTPVPASWKTTEDYIEVIPGTGDIQTRALFDDFDLHAEFWIPYLPEKLGQDRGNSGIFLQGRYEIQVLDTWANETYLDGICGALYKIIAPSFNASLPPEHWQTYDIHFVSPKVAPEGNVLEPGEVTVVLNGHTVIDRGKFDHPTGSAKKMKQGVPGPIRLQDHGSAVRFRNLILTPLH